MRAKGPATCLCDELRVSLHMAVALNLGGLPSVCAAARAAALVIQGDSCIKQTHLGSVLGKRRDFYFFFFFGTSLFSFPKGPENC